MIPKPRGGRAAPRFMKERRERLRIAICHFRKCIHTQRSHVDLFHLSRWRSARHCVPADRASRPDATSQAGGSRRRVWRGGDRSDLGFPDHQCAAERHRLPWRDVLRAQHYPLRTGGPEVPAVHRHESANRSCGRHPGFSRHPGQHLFHSLWNYACPSDPGHGNAGASSGCGNASSGCGNASSGCRNTGSSEPTRGNASTG